MLRAGALERRPRVTQTIRGKSRAQVELFLDLVIKTKSALPMFVNVLRNFYLQYIF